MSLSLPASLTGALSGPVNQRDPPSNGPKIWNCVNCRRRKLKCSRSDPCTQCTKTGIECHFPVTGRLPRRTRDTSTTVDHSAAASSAAAKQTELLSRLRRLEAVVTELAGQVEEGSRSAGSGVPSVSVPASVSTDNERAAANPDSNQESRASVGNAQYSLETTIGAELDEEFGNFLTEQDGGMRIGKGFWSVFCDEVDHIFEAVQDVADMHYDASDASSSDAWAEHAGAMRSNHQRFTLGQSASTLDSRLVHPLPSQMLFICQTFEKNVDPFVKILHVPSLRSLVAGLTGGLSALQAEQEALLMAVSLAAVVSLDDEEVAINFGVAKAQLLARYRLGTEQALARAEFLTTTSISVVQAFAIYVTILPQLAAQSLAWPLVGALLRVATSIGLHKDQAETDKYSSREAEERRRLWWHICFIDSRARCRSMPGLQFPRIPFDTKMPTNASQDETALHGSEEPILQSEKFTDVTPLVVRCELWLLSRTLQQQKPRGKEYQLHLLKTAKTQLGHRLAAIMDREKPLYMFTLTLLNLFFANAELAMLQSRPQEPNNGSSQSQGGTLQICLEIVRSSHALRTKPEWKHWRWQLAGHVPWRALLVGLVELRRHVWTQASDIALEIFRDELQAARGDDVVTPQYQKLTKLLSIVQARGQMSSTEVQEAAKARDTLPDAVEDQGEANSFAARLGLGFNFDGLDLLEDPQSTFTDNQAIGAPGTDSGELVDFAFDIFPSEDVVPMDWVNTWMDDDWF